jgi:hypothetical protein
MDTFIPAARQIYPTEQSIFANQRNPQSMMHLWRKQVPLHQGQRQHQTNLGQISARQQRLDKYPSIAARDMFPFRVFVPPPQFQANPMWEDDFGAANWRTFGVWTGCATGWWNFTSGTDPGGNSYGLYLPLQVFVPFTCGYNAVNTDYDVVVNGENYNEVYSNFTLGLYGPGPFTPPSQEIFFTCPPGSTGGFWIEWVTSNVTFPTSRSWAMYPVLKFGGYYVNEDGSGSFGDAGYFGTADFNSPAQVVPYAPGYSTPNQGNVMVATIITGSGYTGNDGQVQIFQNLRQDIPFGPVRPSYQGPVSLSTLYLPGEVVFEDTDAATGTFMNATGMAIYGYDPTSGLVGGNSGLPVPYGDGIAYAYQPLTNTGS